jgi:hypothetical protein
MDLNAVLKVTFKPRSGRSSTSGHEHRLGTEVYQTPDLNSTDKVSNEAIRAV